MMLQGYPLALDHAAAIMLGHLHYLGVYLFYSEFFSHVVCSH